MKKKYIKPQSIVIDIIIEPFLAGSLHSYGINSEGNEGNFICDESEDEYEESKKKEAGITMRLTKHEQNN